MENTLEMLEPKALWKNFYKLTQIPHPSAYTEQIRQFLIEFAQKNHLKVKTDKAGNVLISKKAYSGCDDLKPVILQAHMDMVPQKNEGISHDFEKDPLSVFVEDGWVKAKDTTLGSDNGIGVAAALAVLESKRIKHGPLEVLITNDEETGMFGAFGLSKNFVKGEIMMNLDSEDEGELFVGCAGGIDADFSFKYKKEKINIENPIAIKVSLKGLHGGHSGVDIHLERANANKLMVRFLKIATINYDACLVSFNGGSLRNAIPREAFVKLVIPAENESELMELIDETEDMFNFEYKGKEEGISLKGEKVALPSYCLPQVVQENLINSLFATPDGVYRHIPEMPEVVESSNNLAIVHTDGEKVLVRCLVRSSLESKKYELCSLLESLYSMAGAEVKFGGAYPGWQPNFDSPILGVMRQIYKNKNGVEPVVKVIHAGLECGIIGAVESNLDMISFGPTIRFPHSPNEKVEIASVAKFWDFLVEVLENVPGNI